MSNELPVFFVGIWIGIVGMAAINAIVPSSYVNQVRNAIKACEAELPRSQKCELTAIPKVKE